MNAESEAKIEMPEDAVRWLGRKKNDLSSEKSSSDEESVVSLTHTHTHTHTQEDSGKT